MASKGQSGVERPMHGAMGQNRFGNSGVLGSCSAKSGDAQQEHAGTKVARADAARFAPNRRCSSTPIPSLLLSA